MHLLLVANWQPLATALPKPGRKPVNSMRLYAVAMPAGTLPILQDRIDGLFMDRMYDSDSDHSILTTSQLVAISEAIDLARHPDGDEGQNVVFEGASLMPLHVLTSELLCLMRQHGRDAQYEALMVLLLAIPRSVAVTLWRPFGLGG